MRRPVLLVLALLLLFAGPAWAAFPVIQGTAATTTDGDVSNSTGSDFTINLPAGIQVGEMLVCAAVVDATDTSNITASGWTQQAYGGDTSVNLAVLRRVADGSEGATFTAVATGALSSEDGHAICVRISGQHATTAPEHSITTQLAMPVDLPSRTASWGAEDTLWLAAVAWSSNVDVTAAPTNYVGLVQISTCSTCGIAIATRDLNAASDDPGAFTGGSGSGFGITMAIRPAAAVAAATGSSMRLLGVGQ